MCIVSKKKAPYPARSVWRRDPHCILRDAARDFGVCPDAACNAAFTLARHANRHAKDAGRNARNRVLNGCFGARRVPFRRCPIKRVVASGFFRALGRRRDRCCAAGSARPLFTDRATPPRHHGCRVLRYAGDRLWPGRPRRRELANPAQACVFREPRHAGLARLHCDCFCGSLAATVANGITAVASAAPLHCLCLRRRPLEQTTSEDVVKCPLITAQTADRFLFR